MFEAPIVPLWMGLPIRTDSSAASSLTVVLPKVEAASRQYVSGYTVQMRSVGEDAWTTYEDGLDPSVEKTTLEDLEPGSTIVIRVLPELTPEASRVGFRAGPSAELEVDLPEGQWLFFCFCVCACMEFLRSDLSDKPAPSEIRLMFGFLLIIPVQKILPGIETGTRIENQGYDPSHSSWLGL